jgi:hypothetical protein
MVRSSQSEAELGPRIKRFSSNYRTVVIAIIGFGAVSVLPMGFFVAFLAKDSRLFFTFLVISIVVAGIVVWLWRTQPAIEAFKKGLVFRNGGYVTIFPWNEITGNYSFIGDPQNYEIVLTLRNRANDRLTIDKSYPFNSLIQLIQKWIPLRNTADDLQRFTAGEDLNYGGYRLSQQNGLTLPDGRSFPLRDIELYINPVTGHLWISLLRDTRDIREMVQEMFRTRENTQIEILADILIHQIEDCPILLRVLKESGVPISIMEIRATAVGEIINMRPW